MLPTRTMVSLDEESAQRLLAQAEQQLAEAAKIEGEATYVAKSLEDQLAELMFVVDVPLKIQQQEQMGVWDEKGQGSLIKGQFRNHLRLLGLTIDNSNTHEADALFESWDSDGNGSLDMAELKNAMRRMHHSWIESRRRAGEPINAEVMGQITMLRASADAAKAAVAAWRRAEACADDLRRATERLDGMLEVQLGALIARRGLKPADIVGAWSNSRAKRRRAATGEHHSERISKDGTRELSKQEFKEELSSLLGLGARVADHPRGGGRKGAPQQRTSQRAPSPPPSPLLAGGCDVSRAALGTLFDRIDRDGSGSLDMSEVRAAFQEWTKCAFDAQAELRAKKLALDKHRRRSATRIAMALRPRLLPEAARFSQLHGSPVERVLNERAHERGASSGPGLGSTDGGAPRGYIDGSPSKLSGAALVGRLAAGRTSHEAAMLALTSSANPNSPVRRQELRRASTPSAGAAEMRQVLEA